MKNIVFVMFIFLTVTCSAKEGMWIPALLGAVEDDMQALGLELSADDLYSVNHSSLKDAIVLFGGGCTGEMVSDQGLLFTNHHCGFSYIQEHSSLAHDYLKNGFWAMNRQEELACPGLKVTFIVSMEDVTARVSEGVKEGMSAGEIANIKTANRKAIEEEFKKNNSLLGVQLKAFNYGNQFFVILTKTYNDVRLVGAPPSAIGKFGGDTDNWVWPRHTGDFSVFRVYASSDNEPADYSTSNVPFKPAHHFPISLDGVHEGDFSMVYGFPGKTEHFLTSYAVDYLVNKSNPLKIEMRNASLDILKRRMNASDEVRIKYAAKQSNIANAWKKWMGQQIGLKNFDAIEQKKKFEQEFSKKIMEEKSVKYQNVLPELQSLYQQLEPINLQREAFVEYVFFGTEMFAFAHNFENLIKNYDTLKANGKLEETIQKLKTDSRSFYKNFDLETEKEVYASLTTLYGLGNGEYDRISSNDPNPGLASLVYTQSIFRDSTVLFTLLDNFNKKSLKKFNRDYFFKESISMFDEYNNITRPEFLKLNAQIESLMQQYVEAITLVFPKDDYWSDANSTLRISYGKVEGSIPHDGMIYNYYTTADGILEKFDPANPDFEMPERLIELLEAKNFGVYGENDELRICYTGSNHTTGGNSGSPALNSKGYLMGINFDRSWESTMSDVVYNPEICRNIMVDIRYVLWVIDVYANADWLLGEMTLVKKSDEEPEMR